MTLGPDPAADPDATPIFGVPAGAAPGAAPGAPGGAPGPGQAPPPARPRAGGRTWHRFHYAVGVFLIAYGVTGLLSGFLLWSDRQDEIDGYFASGPATGMLVLVKLVEGALVLCAVAGVALRRDILFVPSTAGWMAGFAMFAVLDVFTGRWGGLAEHLLYLAGFVVLLFLSYGLSAKAQLASAPRQEGDTPPGDSPDDGSSSGPHRLTRTQEFALQAINRAAALTGPRPRPGRHD
ncbi:hypothetical protein ETD83_03340 [Actinomadura soli]|uniref:Uncharacterized protein n=1 Tax=Actinomadura soli TaxID=2508997 RepID=A0A5C4JJL0_9ACTN|nr:hypothetical protein [Actinomadura soli]TMR06799.1 hypothetical protein ETD83_03340 [Actinomadura soli]